MTISGGCLCQAVRYQADEQAGAGHCQCTDCRKSSGSGHCSHMAVPEASFRLTGEMRFFDKQADSGNTISRGFCPTCGAPVYSKNSGMPGFAFVRASSLDDPEVFKPTMAVYTSRGPSWDTLDPALPAFDEMPGNVDRPEALR